MNYKKAAGCCGPWNGVYGEEYDMDSRDLRHILGKSRLERNAYRDTLHIVVKGMARRARKLEVYIADDDRIWKENDRLRAENERLRAEVEQCQGVINAERKVHDATIRKLEAECEGWELQVKVAREDVLPRMRQAEAEVERLRTERAARDEKRCETCRHCVDQPNPKVGDFLVICNRSQLSRVCVPNGFFFWQAKDGE